MKSIFKTAVTFFIIIAAGNTAFAQAIQPATGHDGAILILKEPAYDFGKIPQGRPVSHEFEIMNNGTDTLKIENVQASCGCTTPVWKKEPVPPHGSAKILVGYNAVAEGSFEKSVNITYNFNQLRSLVIRGNVYKAPTTVAPLNTSLEFLRQIN